MDGNTVKKFVRERYAGIARQGTSCCGPEGILLGRGGKPETGSLKIGYSSEEIGAVPPGPISASDAATRSRLLPCEGGEVVLDLGSGAGFDCFLAARAVGPEGKAIGVDMTPDMIEKARGTPKKGNIETSSSGSGRSRIFPRPTIPWTPSSPTASSISPRTKGRSFRKRIGSLSRAGG